MTLEIYKGPELMKAGNFKSLALVLAVATSLTTACTPVFMESRDVVADRLARPAFMVERVIPVGPFALTAWERIHQEGTTANIYIEGDGLAWLTPTRRSLDPTPSNPIALNLAALDKAKNVAWLARPCQYTGMADGSVCDYKYWTGSRLAPEVISAYHEALDNIKRKYNITGFNLAGYSGGAGIAALVAADRDDILSLRTIAGNMDTETFTNYHNVSPMSGSLNPLTVAPELKGLPQHHFIGGNDDVVPPAIFHSWSQASGETDCVKYTFITENEHEDGWAEKWPKLLTIPVECKGPAAEPLPLAPIPPEFFDAAK